MRRIDKIQAMDEKEFSEFMSDFFCKATNGDCCYCPADTPWCGGDCERAWWVWCTNEMED